MGKKVRGFLALGLFLGLMTTPQDAVSATLPKSTQELLKKFKLQPSALGNVDKDLEVPKEWAEKARKEGKVRWRSTPATPEDLKLLLGPFKERYPYIEVDFSGTNQEDRSVKTLMAYRAGRVLTDILSSFGGFFEAYKHAHALENLGDIPNVKKLPEEARDAQGLWTGINQNYWCMSYNTKFINKTELPRKWEDLLGMAKLKDGKLALGNRPQVWALNVWKIKGEKWTTDFLTKLFAELKPQLRREGLNQIANLVGIGEVNAAIPSNYKRPYQLSLDGAPIAFTCPEPVPASVEDMAILKGSPSPYAAKIFVNWIVSKEGQLAQYAFEYAAPLDKDLRPKLLPFADQIVGRQESFRDHDLEATLGPKLFEVWNGLWLKSSKPSGGR